MPAIDTTTTNFSGALARVTAALLEIPKNLLRLINLDIPAAIVTIFGTLTMLRTLRPAIVSALGETFGIYIDELELYTQALSQAHANCLSAATSLDLQALSDEAVALREVLFADATALVKRKLIPSAELAELRGNVGFRNQVFDVLQLVSVFHRHWPTIEARTGVKFADLDSAEQLAQRFVNALGEREQAATSELVELRQRAYTKVLDLYDQIRRAVTFLRWAQGDVSSIVPSLWAGRGGHRPDDVTAPTSADPTAPVVATPVVTEPAAVPIAPGLPGASPFMH